ncbi:g7931 [Coccomyxa elongata]
MVNAINNNATIILQNATSVADMTVKVAQADALATMSAAKNSGLLMLYDALNMTRGDQKARLDYVQSLLNNRATSLHVGYQTRFLASQE